MCDHHSHEQDDLWAQQLLARHPLTLGRRSFLSGLGAAIGVGLLPGEDAVAAVTEAGASATPSGLSALRAAMHVHASWSEQEGSWRSQFDQASRNGIDVLWMTDHDHTALAADYLTSLNGCPMTKSTKGRLAVSTATNSAGAIHLVARSASSGLASVTYSVESVQARNYLRTGLAGTIVTVTFGSCRVDHGGSLDVVVTLSTRPAQSGRPAGQYALRYRFGSSAPGYSIEPDGRTGRVSLALPPAGTALQLDPTADFQRLWPELHAPDNGFYGLAFVATSPRSSATVNCSLRSIAISRTHNNEADIIALHQEIIDTYAADFPQLAPLRSVEVSARPNAVPHCNIYGAPPQFRRKPGSLPPTTRRCISP